MENTLAIVFILVECSSHSAQCYNMADLSLVITEWIKYTSVEPELNKFL